ncbi:MAG: M4 family metallopeptidase [Bacteroidales bacterium]
MKTNSIHKFHCILRKISLSVIILFAAGCYTNGQKPTDRISMLHPLIERTQNPRFLKLKPDVKIKVVDLFSSQKHLFGLGADDQMVNVNTIVKNPDWYIYRYQQYYKNLAVEFAQVIVHERERSVRNIIGEWAPGLSLDATPALNESQALQYALAHCEAVLYLWDLQPQQIRNLFPSIPADSSLYPQGQLCIVNDKTDFSGTFLLAWKFTISAIEPMKHVNIYVNASNGEIIHEFSLIATTDAQVQGTANTLHDGLRNISTTYRFNIPGQDPVYILQDFSRGVDIITWTLNQDTTIPGAAKLIFNDQNHWEFEGDPIRTGPTIHWGLITAFDYFNNPPFNRNSYDDAGGAIHGYSNYGNKFNNAGWVNGSFIFGDGDGYLKPPYVSLDLIGHEFTHAVTQYSANLIYAGESGALDEGFSDLFGYAIKCSVKGGNWTFGEDFNRGYPVRSLSNPLSTGQPDTYKGYRWWNTANVTEANDFGGVHYNCGVMNKWFYLLSEGGKGTNTKVPAPGDEYSVEGLGMNAVVQMAYDVLTIYLPNSLSNFDDMREACITYALNQDGVDECHDMVRQIKNAWYAVGVGPQAFTLDDSLVEHPGCGENNGKITLLVTTEDPEDDPIFDWSDGSHDFYIDELAPGDYSVTITDPKYSCTIEASFTLEEKEPFQLIMRHKNESHCHANDGWAAVFLDLVPDESPTYIWSTGDSTYLVENLPPGKVFVTVTDGASGCEITDQTTIEAFLPKVEISPDGGIISRCPENGPFIGVVANVFDCPACKYIWSHGDTMKASEAPPGIVMVTVMDSSGCVDRDTVKLELRFLNCSSPKHKRWKIPVFISGDPNDIIGPVGYGQPMFMAKADKLPYVVNFENDPELATAPATKVSIEVPIPDEVAMFSLKLGDFGFANMNFSPPPNTTTYSIRLDVSDSLGVWVDLIAGIDVDKRKVFWIFQAIDPETGVSPIDPLKGFLPVNDSVTRAGEGYVNFTWKPANQTLTGDTIPAKASIVFDLNETIATNIWTNTIDAFPPSSSVTSFFADTDSTTFHLSVTGSDDTGGSGIAFYSLYVSENNGPFQKYEDFVPEEAVIFSGNAGKNYRFFSLATDKVGQKEAMKSVAEAQVIINPDLPAIYGNLIYDNVAGSPLNQVMIRLKNLIGQTRDSCETNSSGTYMLFPPSSGEFTLSPILSKAWGGSNAADALMVVRHFVGLDTLEGLRLRAADVNLTHTLNAVDALTIARRFVDPAYPFQAEDWLFNQDTLNFTNQDLMYHFKGICAGDVDASYLPPNIKPEPTLDLVYPGTTIIQINEVIDIPIRIGKEAEVGAISLILNYRTEFIDIVDVISGSSQGDLVFTDSGGVIRIAWYNLEPMKLGKGDILLYIRLKAKDLPGNLITLFNLETESSLADRKAKTLTDVPLLMNKMKIEVPSSYAVFQCHPNPFASGTAIHYSLPEKAKVKVIIYDVLGIKLQTLLDEEKDKGNYTLTWDGIQYQEGTYIAEFQAFNEGFEFRKTIRMIKMNR